MRDVKLAVPVLLLAACLATGTVGQRLRVGCRLGQPPFNDAPSLNATTCEGLFGEAWSLVAARANISYDLTILNTSSLDRFLAINATTGASLFDVIIGFHTVTPERLLIHDFSVAVYQASDTVALNTQYTVTPTSLTDSILRKSVLHMWTVMTSLAVILAGFIFVFESFTEDSPMVELPLWRRPLWAAEMALEVALSVGCSEDLKSQFSQSLRSGVAIMCFFVLNIFGALITSQLTAASLSVATTSVNDLRGGKIAIASSTLVPYLTGIEVGATVVSVPNIEEFARGFYNGEYPDFDGFSTATPIVNYLYSKYKGKAKGYTLSPPYFKTGEHADELKAFPLSKALPLATKRKIDEVLQDLREGGALSDLIAKYVPDTPDDSNNDLPVEDDAWLALQVSVALSYCIFGLLVFGTLGYAIVKAIRAPADPHPPQSPVTVKIHEPNVLFYNGQHVAITDPHHIAVLNALFESTKCSLPNE